MNALNRMCGSQGVDADGHCTRCGLVPAEGFECPPGFLMPERFTLDGIERDHVCRVLREHQGNKETAAKALDVSRRSLYRMLARWGLPKRYGHPSVTPPERIAFDPALVGVIARLLVVNNLHAVNREDTIGVLMRCGAFREDAREAFTTDLAAAIDARASELRAP